jgi:hypothetical protein
VYRLHWTLITAQSTWFASYGSWIQATAGEESSAEAEGVSEAAPIVVKGDPDDFDLISHWMYNELALTSQ